MNTSKPIATISYNSIPWLEDRLTELLRNRTISAWFFMPHKAEKDEKKDHIHVWLNPNKKLDTMALQDFLKEPVDGSTKPLGCIDFTSSKIDDAVLYYAHYKPYLAWKGQSREYHYDWNEFHTSDPDFMDNAIYHALHCSEFAERLRIMNALDNSPEPAKLISSGIIPLQLSTQVRAYLQLQDDTLERNGRSTHTPSEPEHMTDPDEIVTADGTHVSPDGEIIASE